MVSHRSAVYATLRQPSLVDFPGRMAAVLFTTGCNFRCGFCHNAALLGRGRPGYTWDQLAELCARFRREWVQAAVVTGGEPTLAPALPETLTFLRERDFEIKLDSNGSCPDVLTRVLHLVDFVAMDVKCSLGRYPEFVGFSATESIARSIRVLLESGKPCEFRTTVIAGVHDDAEIHGIGAVVRGAPSFAVQPFVPRDDLPDPGLRVTPRTPPQALERAAEILRGYVGEVRVLGN